MRKYWSSAWEFDGRSFFQVSAYKFENSEKYLIIEAFDLGFSAGPDLFNSMKILLPCQTADGRLHPLHNKPFELCPHDQ